MGVHDNTDSKYNVMGSSSFSKIAPKRPATIVTFGESPNKIQKHEDVQNSQSGNGQDKPNVSLHQQRKSLPVYRLRKR